MCHSAESIQNGAPLAHSSGGRGVVLVYLVREQEPKFDTKPSPALPAGHPEKGLIVGFSMYLPHAAVGTDTVLKFRVLHGDDASVAAVDAPL